MLDPGDILLTDQVAIVTGGAQGIGAGIAENFARFGAHVVIADKNEQMAEETAYAIGGRGPSAMGVKCDVRDLEQVRRMTDLTMEKYGRVDILVNNAGGSAAARFWISSRADGRNMWSSTSPACSDPPTRRSSG